MVPEWRRSFVVGKTVLGLSDEMRTRISSKIAENTKSEYKSPLSHAPDIAMQDEAEQSIIEIEDTGDVQPWSLNGGKLQQQQKTPRDECPMLEGGANQGRQVM